MKTKIIPFDLETAKKIQAGEIEGRIVTDTNHNVRILCLDAISVLPVIVLIKLNSGEESLREFDIAGYSIRTNSQLFIELQEESPKHEFKPFEKVLVRKNDDDVQYWQPKTYSFFHPAFKEHVMTDGMMYAEVLPYEGNENLVGTITKHTHLVGTTDKP
jgi:hypothetical protein